MGYNGTRFDSIDCEELNSYLITFLIYRLVDPMARITVEDCLEQERNRFSLVLLASKRAKDLLDGQQAVTNTKGNKAIVSALREIADGKVSFKVEGGKSLLSTFIKEEMPDDYS